MEFAPDGIFEDRRSLVAHAPRQAHSFKSVQEENGGRVELDTGALTIITGENDKAFFPANLEVHWQHEGLLQYWRPGDRDYFNLGGTVRSLDRIGNVTTIEGVHPADDESPDKKATSWLAWLQCEDDPWFYEHSPEKDRPGLNGDFHEGVRYDLPTLLRRTKNHTLDHLRYGPGILSRSGYFLLNDSESTVMDEDDFPVERNRPGYQDWYFFAYGTDFRAALRDYITLTGPAPLPSKPAFGLMFCRWPAYDEKEAKAIVAEFEEQGTPLSTLILDMEWHKEGWGSWDWDETMYADPAGFFDWCHQKNLAVSLNDHPLDIRKDDSHFAPYLEKAGTAERVRTIHYNKKNVEVVDVNICDKREALAFLDVCHREINRQGLDFWWNDGCKGRVNGAINQLVANKLFFEEMISPENRGMLLARYGGLGSHRYGVVFTGDTLCCWEVLAMECEYNVRAGQIGLAHVSHDIGGFAVAGGVKLIDTSLFIRWLQFGVFNPVIRFHSAPGAGSRKPWDYGEFTTKVARHWLRVRNSLIPAIYTAARHHHETGVPLVRGLYFEHPSDTRAYRFDAFYFGDSVVVAPILGPLQHREVYLPEGNWYRFEKNSRVAGGAVFLEKANLEQIPVFVQAGSILVRQDPDASPAAAHVGQLWLDIYPGSEGQAELYEDDGRSPAYLQGEYCRTAFTLKSTDAGLLITGAVQEGQPLGEKRSITLTVSLDQAPESVLLNDTTALTAEEEKTAGRYRIILPELAASEPFRVLIR